MIPRRGAPPYTWTMTPRRYERVCRVLQRRQPDLAVLLDNVHKPHNFAAILRSCDAVGVAQAHCVWPNPGLRPSNHTSSGSAKWVQIKTHRTLAEAVDELHAADYQVCAAHVATRATDYRSVDYTKPTAFLLGAELSGLSQSAVALADQHVYIPMVGMVQSLNVSVAAAILLFAAQQQRVDAGLYDERRLDDATYARLMFEWLHPEVADYCKRNELPYPALDDHGEIVASSELSAKRVPKTNMQP